MSAAELLILIKAKDEASKVLHNVSGGMGKLGTAGKIAGIGMLGAVAGIGAVTFALGGCVSAAADAQKIMAQTDAVIASTGGAAGMTARDVSDLASELSKVIPIDDELIQQTENMLLTFTKVGKEVFPAATEAALDMATALGDDPVNSAVRLGKALNDPIAGVTALRKVGVMLTDQQRDQIKAFVESGDIMSAQKVILDELATEFGNSGRAAGETFAGKMAILNTQIGNVKEGIGMALLPVLMQLADLAIKHVVPAIQAGVDGLMELGNFIRSGLAGDVESAATAFALLPAPLQQFALFLMENKETIIEWANIAKSIAQDVVEGWVRIFKELGPLLLQFGNYLKDNKPVAIALAAALGVLLVVLFGIPALILAIIVAGGLLAAHWDEIKAKAIETWESFAPIVQDALTLVWNIVVFYFNLIRVVIEYQIQSAINFVNLVMAILQGDWGEAWSIIKDQVALAWQLIRDVIGLYLGLIRDILVFFVAVAQAILNGAWDAMKSAASAAWSSFRDTIRNAIQSVINKIQDLIDKINDIPTPGDVVGGLAGKAKGLLGFADGGFASGWILAGEQGPELIRVPGASKVFRADETQAMMNGNGGSSLVQHVHIQQVVWYGDAKAGLEALAVNI